MIDPHLVLSDHLETHKIILAGLDAVGKTSIYRKMIEGVEVKDIQDISPTKGIERHSQIIMDHQVVFWELGGQAMYRSQYFTNPQTFQDTSLLVFIIDVQNKDRFDEALDYLLEILMIVKKQDRLPRIYVLMHKFDPGKIPELKENFLEASKIFHEIKNIPSLNVTRFPTSIYSENLEFAFKKIIEGVVPDYIDPLQGLFEDEFEDFEDNDKDVELNINLEKEVSDGVDINQEELKDEITRHFESALERIRIQSKFKREK